MSYHRACCCDCDPPTQTEWENDTFRLILVGITACLTCKTDSNGHIFRGDVNGIFDFTFDSNSVGPTQCGLSTRIASKVFSPAKPTFLDDRYAETDACDTFLDTTTTSTPNLDVIYRQGTCLIRSINLGAGAFARNAFRSGIVCGPELGHKIPNEVVIGDCSDNFFGHIFYGGFATLLRMS